MHFVSTRAEVTHRDGTQRSIASVLKRLTSALAALALGSTLVACGSMSPSAPVAAAKTESGVFFTNLKDGDAVTSPFVAKFGVRGMALEPAMPVGELKANSGHHHVLINLESIKSGDAIPFSDQHVHFGKAQTENEFKLAPGNYRLTLQYANAAHVSYGPAMSQTIRITVK